MTRRFTARRRARPARHGSSRWRRCSALTSCIGIVASTLANWIQLVLAIAGRALGGLAALHARLGLARQPQSQHVHADRRSASARRTSTASLATVAPGLFPDGFRMHGRVEPYFDTAVVVTALVLLGQVLEIRARSARRGAARAARPRAEDRAARARADARHDVPIADVHVGDLLRVRPGEKSPRRRRRHRRAQRSSTSRW